MLAIALLTGIICASTCVAMLASAPAFAEEIYFPGVSFGWHVNRTAIAEGRGSEANVCPAPGHPADQCEPGESGSAPGQLKEPLGVAVNDSTDPLLDPAAGDVYVVDAGNNRVERFNAGGEYEGQFDGSGSYENLEEIPKDKTGPAAPTGAFASPEQVAVNNDEGSPSFGDVYVTDTGHDVIDEFSPVGEYLGQIADAEECEHEEETFPCQHGKSVTFPFDTLRNIAVGPTGELFVYASREPEFGGARIDQFNEKGEQQRNFAIHAFPHSNHALAVDSRENVFVGVGIEQEVAEFTADGDSICQFDKHVNALASVPLTGTPLGDNLLFDNGNSIHYGSIEEPCREPAPSFPGEDVPEGYEGLSESFSIGVNANASVYTSERSDNRIESFNYVSVPQVTTEAATGVTETEIRFNGSVNSEGEEILACYFEYETTEYPGEATAGGKATCEGSPESISGQSQSVAVSRGLTGLPPASARSFRLVVVTGAGVRAIGQKVTISRPTMAHEAVSGVGASVARVNAEIGPGGLPTCYWIEYGASIAYGSRKPEEGCISVGEGRNAVEVDTALVGLSPDGNYHYRVVAQNALGLRPGGDAVFATFAPTMSRLPDERTYELVSPVGAGHDTEAYAPSGMLESLNTLGAHGIETERPFQAKASGGAVAYLGDPPPVGGDGDVGDTLGNEYLAERMTGGGWTQADMSPAGYLNEYVAFSRDLSVGLLTTSELLVQSAPAEGPVGYANLYRQASGMPPEPLITSKPPCKPVEFGSVENGGLSHGIIFGGGNAGAGTVAPFGHLLFEANAALPSRPSATAPGGCPLEDDLYDWVGGHLYLVNVAPGGKSITVPGATFGRQGPNKDGIRSPETDDAISADGSRIYWSKVKIVEFEEELEARPLALYVRENDTQPESPVGEEDECLVPTDACTMQVDAAALPGKEKEKEEMGGEGRFWTASSDGSKVFFTDTKPLTAGSTAEAGRPDLYEYDLKAPIGERLSDLSFAGGVHADVQGVVGASEDGSYVYFVANGVLAEGAVPGDCTGEYKAAQTCNLYVNHDGATTFVATLSGEDGDFTHGNGGNDGDWQADPGHRTAELTPDGRSVVFMSRKPLTGYSNGLDNVDITELFVYSAETGHLICVSCNPSGEAPVASPSFPDFGKKLQTLWGSFVPISESLADYQPRVISENGKRVFFDSIEPLVPQDRNGFLDVYEWEAQNEGSCTRPQGCVYLLSGGESADNSYLVDANGNGDDVFFVTREDLVKADRVDYDELYDARVGGVEPREEAQCSGTGCQGAAPPAPSFATPPSVTFEGVGNFPPEPSTGTTAPTPKCPKGKRLSHNRCVKKAKARRAQHKKPRKSRRLRRRSGKGRGR